jgi:hypothetical protein
MRHNHSKDSTKVYLRIAVLLILGVVLISGIFYHGFEIDVKDHLPGYVLCPFRVVTHIPCPGCGMTRAMLYLGQLNFGKAIHLNVFSIPLFVVMLIYIYKPKMIRILRNELVLKVLLVTVLVLWVLHLNNMI